MTEKELIEWEHQRKRRRMNDTTAKMIGLVGGARVNLSLADKALDHAHRVNDTIQEKIEDAKERVYSLRQNLETVSHTDGREYATCQDKLMKAAGFLRAWLAEKVIAKEMLTRTRLVRLRCRQVFSALTQTTDLAGAVQCFRYHSGLGSKRVLRSSKDTRKRTQRGPSHTGLDK